jgi:hypothetical protein
VILDAQHKTRHFLVVDKSRWDLHKVPMNRGKSFKAINMVFINGFAGKNHPDYHGAELVDGGSILVGIRCEATFEGCEFRNNHALGAGGAVWSRMAPVTISDTIFEGNRAFFKSGALSLTLSMSAGEEQPTVTLTRVQFLNNEQYDLDSALAQGGGGAVGINQGHLRMDQCLFQGNEAQGAGGGLYMGSTEALITNSQFHGNRARLGGGFSCQNCSPRVEDTVFAYNRAIFRDIIPATDGMGGAVRHELWDPQTREFYYKRVTWENNVAESAGGAVISGLYTESHDDLDDGCATCHISYDECKFCGNQVEGSDRSHDMYHLGGYVKMDDLTFGGDYGELCPTQRTGCALLRLEKINSGWEGKLRDVFENTDIPGHDGVVIADRTYTQTHTDTHVLAHSLTNEHTRKQD